MGEILTATIIAIVSMFIGITGKIIWDWLKIRRNGKDAYSYNGGSSSIMYQIKQDIAMLQQLADQRKEPVQRLFEETHIMYEDRDDIKEALNKQNAISIEANILLKDLRDELTKSTAQIAAVAEGLAAALRQIKEK